MEAEETSAGKDTTVKCCLKKAFLGGVRGRGKRKRNFDAFADVVDEAVVHVSKVTRRGSLVALLTVLRTLRDNGGVLPDDFFGDSSDTFFDQCFKAGLLDKKGKVPKPSKRSTANKYISEAVADEKITEALSGMATKRQQGDSNLIVAAALQYSTSFFNFFDYEMPRRVGTYVKALWQSHYPARGDGPRGQKRVAIDYVADALWRSDASPPKDVAPSFLKAIEEAREELIRKLGPSCPTEVRIAAADERRKDIAALQRHRKSEGREPSEDLKKEAKALGGEKKRLKERVLPLRRIEYVFWLQRRLENLNASDGGIHRSFCMAPISSEQRKHVRFDFNAFRDYLFPRLLDVGGFPEGMLAEDLTAKDMEDLLPHSRGLRSKKTGWLPGKSFTTDGYALCVRYVQGKDPGSGRRGGAPKAKKQRFTTKEEKAARRKEGCVEDMPDDAFVAGMDAGVVRPYTFAWKDSEGELQASFLTRDLYYDKSGVKAHRAIVARRTKRLADAFAKRLAASPKTSSVETATEYVKACSEDSPKVWNEYGDRRLSRSRMAVSIGKRRVLSQFCSETKKIIEKAAGDRPVVLATGFPNFNCCTKGCPSSPTETAFKELKQHFVVLPTDEYLTSQACYRCDEKLEAPKKLVTLRKTNEKAWREVRGIRLCQECFRNDRAPPRRDPGLWAGKARIDRDINAALNIMRVAGLRNEERPECLRRKILRTTRHAAVECSNTCHKEPL